MAAAGRARASDMLPFLSHRDQEMVMWLRCGLSVLEVSRNFNVTQQRVREISRRETKRVAVMVDLMRKAGQ